MQQGTAQRSGLVVLVAFVLSFAVIYGLVRLASPQDEASAIPTPVGEAPVAEVPVGFGTGMTSIGTVVTSEGRTLYRFDEDTPKPPESSCEDRCAVMWPPVVAPDGSAPEIPGVDRSIVGTLVRPDGTVQVTLKGWPLYTYSGDGEPGEADGEGVSGVWHAVGVDGKPAVAGAGVRVPAQDPVQPDPAPADEQVPGAGY
ncbi:MAG: hypothetical protein AB7J32_09455 [Pseudonocardia sp.]